MTDSSGSKTEEVLGKLRSNQIEVLVDLLRKSSLTEASFIEGRFKERAQHFSQTLRFLKAIGWVQEKDHVLKLTDHAQKFRIQDAKMFHAHESVVEAISESSGPYKEMLAGYLLQFESSDGIIKSKPSPQNSLKYSSMRNLLMEVGMVSHRSADNTYVLNPLFAGLFLWARNISGTKSKATLMARAKSKDAIGSAAEVVIFDYEKKRVGSELADRVEHTSAKNPGSCFDIKSFSTDASPPTSRFIEVKAVPADSHQFYWSARELEAAELLRKNYYLYLLPALGGRKFDLTKLQIIQDPYLTVYQNPKSWLKEENVILFRRSNF